MRNYAKAVEYLYVDDILSSSSYSKCPYLVTATNCRVIRINYYNMTNTKT